MSEQYDVLAHQKSEAEKARSIHGLAVFASGTVSAGLGWLAGTASKNVPKIEVLGDAFGSVALGALALTFVLDAVHDSKRANMLEAQMINQCPDEYNAYH